MSDNGSAIAILGATSGIAHATAREWLARATPGETVSFRLVARDNDKLTRVKGDLEVRGATVEAGTYDLAGAEGVEKAVEWVFRDGPVGTVLIAFGDMPSQEEADADPEVAARLLTLNGVQALLAAHLVTLRLVEQGSGTVGVIGSVAGDRGRQSNYLYGAAKAMVATGVEGLQHRVAGTDVRLTLIKPGPTATPMTAHLQGVGKLTLAPVETVARDIVGALAARKPVLYTPAKWRLIMAVVRALPRAVFHRTKL